MSGLDVGLAAAALAFDTFHVCVQAFNFVYIAQHIGVEGDYFRSRLQWEQYRLMEWGLKAGLGERSKAIEKLNWQLALNILKELATFMTSAEALKQQYGLNVTEEDILGSERQEASRASKTGIGKFIARLRPEVYTATGEVIQSNNKILKRLRWAVFGRGQADLVFQRIVDLNNRLYGLLDSADKERLQLGLSALLRDSVSQSTTAAEVAEVKELLDVKELEDDRSIQAAATLKRIRLVIGADKRDDEVRPSLTREVQDNMPKLRKLRAKKLRSFTTGVQFSYRGLEFAQYDGSPVLVEWKPAENQMFEGLKDQVKLLALLLGEVTDISFHSLRCIGYLPWEEEGRYALVYDVPTVLNETEPVHWQKKSLYDFLSEQTQVSLRRRFQIACDLAEALLQLHTAGWLHKGIRSENIIFVAPNGPGAAVFLENPPYLVGYGYSRLDTSEAAAFTQLPDSPLHTDLYRHPYARGMQRRSYRKGFDMYAMGCVFLELALWKRLVDIQSSYTTLPWTDLIADAVQSNKELELPSLVTLPEEQARLDEISHAVGESFREAITLCLSASQEDKETPDFSLETQNRVVQLLHSCRC